MTLNSLNLGSGTLSPAFSAGTLTYTGTTSAASETVTATATDDNDTVIIKANGETIDSGDTVEWEEGENTVTVQVIDGDNPGESATYTVTVTYTPGDG